MQIHPKFPPSRLTDPHAPGRAGHLPGPGGQPHPRPDALRGEGDAAHAKQVDLVVWAEAVATCSQSSLKGGPVRHP